MHESESSHESLNLAHESNSSPSPGLEYYNTGNVVLNTWLLYLWIHDS